MGRPNADGFGYVLEWPIACGDWGMGLVGRPNADGFGYFRAFGCFRVEPPRGFAQYDDGFVTASGRRPSLLLRREPHEPHAMARHIENQRAGSLLDLNGLSISDLWHGGEARIACNILSK